MDKQQDLSPIIQPIAYGLNITIGEINVGFNLFEDMKLVEQSLDMAIKKIKKGILQDPDYKAYLNLIKTKKGEALYAG